MACTEKMKTLQIGPRIRKLPDGSVVDEDDYDVSEPSVEPERKRIALTIPVGFVNYLAGTRWEPLLSEPLARKQSFTTEDGTTVQRNGIWKPLRELFLGTKYTDYSSMNFKVSQPNTADIWGRNDVGFGVPFGFLTSYPKYTVEISVSSTNRDGERALRLGRMLVAAGEIGSVFDRLAQEFLHSKEYEDVKKEEEEKERRYREEAAKREQERQEAEQKRIEDEKRLKEESDAARRQAAGQKAAITRKRNAAANALEQAKKRLADIEAMAAPTDAAAIVHIEDLKRHARKEVDRLQADFDQLMRPVYH